MTAAEARIKAIEKLTSDDDSQYATIKGMIGMAVNKGELECWVYNTPINPEVRSKLYLEGYGVGPTQSDRNESLTKITW